MTQMHPIQKSGSKAFMVRRLSMDRTAGQSRMVRPARNWAYRRPPSSRAMTMESAMSAAPARAGRSAAPQRSAHQQRDLGVHGN